MDLNRFIVLYIGFTSIGIFFGFIGYSILRRDPKDRLNQFLSAFYFLGLLSFIVNIIYATVNNSASQDFINFLGVLTIYFLMLSVVFLLMFTQLLYKPRKLIKTKNQFLILIVYASILSIMFLIPDGIIIKIQSDGTQLSPVWNLPFTFFIIIILSLSASYIFIISYKIYKRFKNKELAKRFKFFIMGVFIFYILFVELAVVNHTNIYIIRQFHTFFQLLIIFGISCLYYGIGVPRNSLLNIDFSPKENTVVKEI